MTELKVYKELTMIKLKDWTVVNTEATIEEVSKMLNSNSIITMDWLWFSKFDLDWPLKRYEPTEVEWFILTQPKDIRERLYKELDVRKQNKQNINIVVVRGILERIKWETAEEKAWDENTIPLTEEQKKANIARFRKLKENNFKF
jgi:hypothetical protein